MQQLWQAWYGGMDPNWITTIESRAKHLPSDKGRMGLQNDNENEQIRRSEVRWFNTGTGNEDIFDLLWYYVTTANKNAFGADIWDIPYIQHSVYNADEYAHYDWHCDVFWENPAPFDRKLSLVVQLSNSDEYEGGDFQFNGGFPCPDPVRLREKGSVIVFPSFLEHRVTPVTAGVRRSLVAWVEGPSWR